LIHVVEGGDYGYQEWHGREGLSPLHSWLGDKPGTLPMVSGVGEAACGVVEWNGGLLVAAWGEHRIEYYTLKPKGQSFSASMQVVIQGGTDFRPVEIVIADNDTLYITDWVNRPYKLHGQGRVWRVTGANAIKTAYPTSGYPSPFGVQASSQLESPTSLEDLHRLYDPDPYVRSAAIHTLSADTERLRTVVQKLFTKPPSTAHKSPSTAHSAAGLAIASKTRLRDSAERVGVALAMQRNGDPRFERHLTALLDDSSADVRYVAARWIADRQLQKHRGDLLKRLQDPALPHDLAMAFLAALARLDGKDLDGNGSPNVLMPLIQDAKSSPALRRAALRAMPPGAKQLKIDLLDRLGRSDEALLRREAVRRLVLHPSTDRDAALIRTAKNHRTDDPELVADALTGLDPARNTDVLVEFAVHNSGILRHTALQSLNGAPLNRKQGLALSGLAENDPDAVPLVNRALGKPTPKRPGPDDFAAWKSLMTGEGNPAAGARVFFNKRLVACASCHAVDGRGARVGPDLTHFGPNRTVEQVLEAILQPSKEVAPQHETWILDMKNGTIVTGFLYAKRVGGAGQEEYIDAAGNFVFLKTDDVKGRRTMPVSIMPPGLINHLTDDELRDLIAFLRHPEDQSL
jgi:putative heme-binding domain-containing protein